MTNTKLFLLIGTSLSLTPNLIFAQCVATQDCETLGYTETSCNGGKGVKCPFGNKWACIGITAEQCTELGFTYTCSGTGEIGIGKDCNGKYQSCTCDSSYQYTCSGTGYTGGYGATCGGKYAACSCADGYEWKDGTCKQQLNGAQGDLFYCNGIVVGVKTADMDFYISLQESKKEWSLGDKYCRNYSFCSSLKGSLPSREQLTKIYHNQASLNVLLSNNGGTKLSKDWYWSSQSGFSGYHCGITLSDGSLSCILSDGGENYVRPVLIWW